MNKFIRLFVGVSIFLSGVCVAPVRADVRSQERVITLREGIKMVLEDSWLIKIALSDKDMAFQDSMIARSALLPHLNANAAQIFYRSQQKAKFNSVVVPTAEKQSYSFGFDVYQTLFDFGKSLSNYQASKELLRAQAENIESVKRVAILEFIVAYFDLLEAGKMIEVAEKEVQSLTSYSSDIEHLYEQGSAVKNDLLPAQVRLADARQRLIAARSGREVALARLNNILALPLREKITVRDVLMKPPVFPEIEEAWAMAQRQRPELAFFRDLVEASSLSAKAKSVENLPTLFADGGYSYTKNKFLEPQDNAFIQLGAKVNLYDGGASRAELLKERSRHGQLLETKDKLVEDIKFEVEDSYLGLKDACEKVLVAKDAVQQAEENVRVNRVKYAEGSATSTDVLEAITLETIARTNYNSNDYELKRNYAKLMYSMGIDLTLIYEMMERRQNGPAKH